MSGGSSGGKASEDGICSDKRQAAYERACRRAQEAAAPLSELEERELWAGGVLELASQAQLGQTWCRRDAVPPWESERRTAC